MKKIFKKLLIMLIKKQYANLLYFIKLFSKFEDKNELVEIDDNDVALIAQALNGINNEIVNPLQDFIDKYDYDGDGIVTYNDLSFPLYVITNSLNDSKFDKTNNTYNGKSLDANNNGQITTIDSSFLMKYRTKLINSFTRDWGDKENDMVNWYKSYYNSHDYTWPTIEEADAHYEEIKNT